MKTIVLTALFASLLLGRAVTAETIFSGSWTGADLANDPTVSFPTRSPQLVGNSLQFLAGNQDNVPLIVLPLVPANLLSGTATITINANLTRLPAVYSNGPDDFDPTFAVSDGMNILWFSAGDNAGGSGWFGSGNLINNTGGDTIEFTEAGFPNVGGSFDVHSQFKLLPASSLISGSFLNGSYTKTMNTALDSSAALDFRFSGNNKEEQYQINSLSIQVEGVPEPSTFALLGMSAFGLLAWAWRRNRRSA
jgi:hypothetical protein